MARTNRMIKFKSNIEYNFIFFEKGLTIYSTKNKKPHDNRAQKSQEKIKLKFIS